MRVFLDFEASSLNDHGYPIEVGWVFEDGRSEAHLIKPAPEWTDWDAGAEQIHGISRDRLQAEGTPHDEVARRLLDVLADHAVYASAPSWDGKWLSVLLRGAGLPRHAMRLKDSDEAHRDAAENALGTAVTVEKREAAIADIIARARLAATGEPTHRAVEDAERERQVWIAVGRIAQDVAREQGG